MGRRHEDKLPHSETVQYNLRLKPEDMMLIKMIAEREDRFIRDVLIDAIHTKYPNDTRIIHQALGEFL